jgi:hypothetical protein
MRRLKIALLGGVLAATLAGGTALGQPMQIAPERPGGHDPGEFSVHQGTQIVSCGCLNHRVPAFVSRFEWSLSNS